MNFSEALRKYMDLLQCSIKELSETSGMPAATISRYLAGKRQPRENGEHLEKLVSGIITLAEKQGKSTVTIKNVRDEFIQSLSKETIQKNISDKLNLLISALNINISKMAHSINYNASFIYKIRKNQRHPVNINEFTSQLVNYVLIHHFDEASIKALAGLLDCKPEQVSEKQLLRQRLQNWLVSDKTPVDNSLSLTSGFLHKLDEFDLADYIRAIHFEKRELDFTLTPPRIKKSSVDRKVKKMPSFSF